MRSRQPTRRAFCTTAALTLFSRDFLNAQPPSARPDVATIDRDRILAAANQALNSPPAPLTTLKASNAPNEFYSEASPPIAGATAFTAHHDALPHLSRQIAAFAAAYHLTRDERYAVQASLLLQSWFVNPATRMVPELDYAGTLAGNSKPHFEGILDSVPLAEIAQALPFLADSKSLTPENLAALKIWFATYLEWLTDSRLAALARDQKDHHGSSWLFQTAACARFTGNDATLADLRHRFKTVTLRAQIVADGTFPHELTTPYPYRNSLFNLDLLSASCLLLSTRFESLWEFELQDGPGLQIVMARHFPYIQDRGAWPYRADLTHFTDLPVRNPSLLFAARAYTRPEYAELWKTLNPDPTIPEIVATFPISQPLLWVAKPHG